VLLKDASIVSLKSFDAISLILSQLNDATVGVQCVSYASPVIASSYVIVHDLVQCPHDPNVVWYYCTLRSTGFPL